MKLAKKIGIGIALVVVCFLVVVAVLPSDYMVAREIVVNAKPEAVFPHINHSQKQNNWMPWRESDPQMVQNFTGPEEGVGSITSWDSKGPMGTGNCVVIESVPNQMVKSKLTYLKPMEMSQESELSLTPDGAGTRVRWAVKGKNSYMGKAVCLFMDMDKMVGQEFEKGLQKLKTIVEPK